MTKPDSPRLEKRAGRNEVALILGIRPLFPLTTPPSLLSLSSGAKKTGKSTLFQLATFREKLRGSEYTINIKEHLVGNVAVAIKRLLKDDGPIPPPIFENPDLQVSSHPPLGLQD